jgi:hypothetical protein
MYGLGDGILSNTDSGRPKLFARIDFGVFDSQSSTLKVVLKMVSGEDADTKAHSPSSLEVAVVERQDILVLIVEALDSVRLALGEVPDVSKAKFSRLMTALLIDSRDKNAAKKYLAPFSHSMPMQLPNSAFLQMLLRSCDVMTGGKITDNLLSNPSTRKDPGFGIPKAPFQVRYVAGVGTLFTQIRRVSDVYLTVRSACRHC